MSHIKLKHLLSVEELSAHEVLGLLKRAQEFKAGTATLDLKRPVYASNLFFESSTRTHRSFEMAERKLGIEVIQFDVLSSSVNKGETLYDTVLTLSALGVDIVVLRHSQDEYYLPLIKSSGISVAIINGGDGRGQHPTQCLLDLMTIQAEFGHFEGLKIAIAGDIQNSRVARSNAILLHKLGAELTFCGPEVWYDHAFNAYGVRADLDEILASLDVLMLLRVQHERHDEPESFTKETYHQTYGLTLDRATHMKPTAIIMHPAPVNRDVELADALVEAPNSRIVSQMSNGVFLRMAVLEAIMAYRGLCA